eukprot:scaffold206911_cov31-Attheya_sp.AAC.1
MGGGKLMRKYIATGCKDDIQVDVAARIIVAERSLIEPQHSRCSSDQPSGSQCSRKSHPNKKRKQTASACIYTPGGKLKSKCVCASCTVDAGQVVDENSRSTIDSHHSRSLSDNESGSEHHPTSHPKKKKRQTRSICDHTPESNQSKVSQLDMGKTSYEEDSDKDEEDSMYQTSVATTVPEWALNSNLRSAFNRQLLNSIGSDDIFHDVETCNLESIFGTKEERYRVRSSTGDWSAEGLQERSNLVNTRGGRATDLRDTISSVANSVAKASTSSSGYSSSSSTDIIILRPSTYEIDNSFYREESSAWGLNHSSPGIVPGGVPIDNTTNLDDKAPGKVPYFPWDGTNLMASSSSSSEISSYETHEETPELPALSPGIFETDLGTALSAIRNENDTASSSDSRSLSFGEE